MATTTPELHPLVEDSALARRLFASTGPAAIVWLVARLYLGYEWFVGGWNKVAGEAADAWFTGEAVRGFAARALESGTVGDNPRIAFGWYVNFLEFIRDSAYPVVGPLVAIGEVVIGAALILGAFVGIFASLGVVLNFSFVFAGSAGVNPLFLVVGLLLMLAWRNAGYYGLDRYLLSAVGTPWQRRPRSQITPTPVTTS
ncbi:MAG TPA: DoxX family protein [Nitriliruptorales bacterium]|nr:DoxX family protein [Nitriliruptorales bacterium]